MLALSSLRSRATRAARWLAPSAAGACAGGLAAGGVEARAASDAFGAAATAGFVALLAVPALLAVGAATRGLVRAWQPAELAADLREQGGAMPRLAAWLVVLQLGALGLAWVMFQASWQLANATAFKPLAVGFAQPATATATLLLLVASSRPAVDLVATLARRLDRRWRRTGRRTLLRPWPLLVTAAASSVGVAYGLERWVVRPRTGALELAFLHAPLLALALTALAHATWARLGRARRLVGGALGVLAIVLAGLAVATALTRPTTALAIWGQRGLAATAIERVFDLDAIRDALPAAAVRPAPRAGVGHPDLVLVTLEGVRADRTPPYGGAAAQPALDALSARGATFQWAFAPSNSAAGSLPSIAAATAPDRVHDRAPGPRLQLAPEHVLLAEQLRAGGYDTAGFVCCAELWSPASRTGLHRGFDHLAIEREGMKLAYAAKTWLQGRASTRPLFVWLHLAPIDDRGARAPGGAGDLVARYDAALTAADQQLAELLAGFADRPPARAPIVIITATHGEPLGDHGEQASGSDLYNGQLRVPLVMSGPGIARARIADTVSLTDLGPMLLDLAGFEAPPGGRTFAELVRGERTATAEGGRAFAAMPPSATLAVIQGRWKLIDRGTGYELYDLHTDPGERANQVTAHGDVLIRLRTLLDARRRAARGPTD